MKALIGKKLGMTKVFGEEGQSIVVTAVEAGPCVVVQRKTKAKDGYNAVQLGFGAQKDGRINKSLLGRFKKCGAPSKLHLREFLVEEADVLKAGDTVTVSILDGVPFVDVVGTTKGRGFQGVVKRYRMAGGPETHGSMSHRRVGAIGQRTWPARIIKGKRMPGHMGNVRVTTQNLKVVSINPEKNLVMIGGCVPGANGSIIIIKQSLKRRVAEVRRVKKEPVDVKPKKTAEAPKGKKPAEDKAKKK